MPFEKLLIILIAAYLVFGPKRLPDIGGSLGRGLREFRNSASGIAEPSTSTPKSAEPGALVSAAPVVEGHHDPAAVKAALESLSEEDRQAVIASLSEAPASLNAPSS